MFLYAASIHSGTDGSDGATVALEGASIAHGNLILHSWALSLDSFWSIDALFYTVSDAVVGLRPGVLYAVPAIIAALVTVVGILMAAEGRTRWPAVVGGVTVVAVLGFPTHALALYLLKGPYHVGTALWALLAFWFLRRGRFDWRFALAVVLLAAGMVGDLLMVAYGVVPVLLAGALAMARRRSVRAGSAAVCAAIGAAVAAALTRVALSGLGGFILTQGNVPAKSRQMHKNVHQMLRLGADLVGVRSTIYGTGGTPGWLQAVHVVSATVLGASIVAAAVLLVVGLVRGSRSPAGAHARARATAESGLESWRLDDMLLVACFGPAVVFVVLAHNQAPEWGRYLTATVIFAAILAGRMCARLAEQLRGRRLRLGISVAGLAVAAGLAAGTVATFSSVSPPQPASLLARWLVAHHLKLGIADYWSSNITTVESDGLVQVRPVQTPLGDHGPMQRVPHQCAATWYAGQHFQFFAYNYERPWAAKIAGTALRTWGTPARVVTVGEFQVMFWNHTLTISSAQPAQR